MADVLKQLKEHEKIIKDQQNKVGELDSSVLMLKSLLNNNSGDGGERPGFLDALETLVENLRKECYSKFALRETGDDLLKRVKVLEDEMKAMDKA